MEETSNGNEKILIKSFQFASVVAEMGGIAAQRLDFRQHHSSHDSSANGIRAIEREIYATLIAQKHHDLLERILLGILDIDCLAWSRFCRGPTWHSNIGMLSNTRKLFSYIFWRQHEINVAGRDRALRHAVIFR